MSHKLKMNRILASALCCCLIVTLANAQGAGMTPPEFDAEKAAGIFMYENEEVLKKLKIESSESKNAINQALNAYNNIMFDLITKNTFLFETLEARFDQNIKIAMQNRNPSIMDGVKAEIKKSIPPIRKEVMEEEIKLNKKMEAILSEKKNAKWLKYQKGVKPSPPQFSR